MGGLGELYRFCNEEFYTISYLNENLHQYLRGRYTQPITAWTFSFLLEVSANSSEHIHQPRLHASKWVAHKHASSLARLPLTPLVQQRQRKVESTWQTRIWPTFTLFGLILNLSVCTCILRAITLSSVCPSLLPGAIVSRTKRCPQKT